MLLTKEFHLVHCTLRIFTENHLNLSKNTIITTKTSSTNTRGSITIDGAYRKNGSPIPIPNTTIIDYNNIMINSDIIYTNKVNNQL